ncbi:MAG: TetR/AcrR family transcriptional regulator [Anaerolineae bacterium]|nr:TetR/AcrR family transcriptional regulator [Chloroflexota bacterium]MCO6445470.1 TetR/AcrR family transcriptional regulator [Anaerolineae bacterium]
MKRTYTSRRREESAERTRQAIINAAITMHSQGITTLPAVAEEAGVSLPTVNKHFPTREHLFAACTEHVMTTLDFPSPDTLADIPDRAQRITQLVTEVFRMHEKTFGVSWTGYRLEAESPVLAKVNADYEDFVGQMVDALHITGSDTLRMFARALLNPLTYRALRLRSGLDFDAAVQHTAQALIALLDT